MTVYPTTKQFIDFLTKEKTRYQYRENVAEKYDMVEISYNCKIMPNVILDSFFTEDGTMSIRAFKLVKFPEDKLPVMLATVNHLNSNFRFMKFIVNPEDCTVQGEVDVCLNGHNDVAAIAHLTFMRSAYICDNAYSEMMKAIWS